MIQIILNYPATRCFNATGSTVTGQHNQSNAVPLKHSSLVVADVCTLLNIACMFCIHAGPQTACRLACFAFILVLKQLVNWQMKIAHNDAS